MSDANAPSIPAASPAPPPQRPPHRRRRRSSAKGRLLLPPSLDDRTVARAPARHRRDAVQEAWLAYLRKKNPNTAVSGYVRRVHRAEQRTQCFSQLELEEQDRIARELGW
jgi:hypothetical protein